MSTFVGTSHSLEVHYALPWKPCNNGFLFCYERDVMLLSDNNLTDIIKAFNSTSRYLDDLLNIDNPYFEQILSQIYPTNFS